jgi:hypothetical protein
MLTPTQLDDGLAYLLRQHLYQHMYVTGWPTPVRRGTDPALSDSARTDFVQRLSEANNGRGGWEQGWANPPGSPRTVVVKRGLRVTARAQGLLPAPGSDAGVELRRPKELTAVSPGYYMALGNRDLDSFRSADIVRWYWNLVPEGADTLIRLLTSALNADDIPFRLKALGDPTRYSRCDAAVLYVPRDDVAVTADVVEATLRRVRGYLKPATPAFTQPLAPGLGLAENPSSGESFGQHRTGILARALVDAQTQGPRSDDELVEAIAGAFRAQGISLEAPFLNPGSRATYDFRFPAETPRSSTDLRAIPGSVSLSGPTDQLAECRHAAHALGTALVREAIWSDDQCTWLAVAPRQDGLDVGDVRHAGVGPDLYAGTAGIAWLLGCLHGVRPDPRLRATALGALRHAVRRGTGTGSPPGLYDGALGIALVTARLSASLAEPGLLETAGRILTTSCRSDPGSADLLSGLSGMILGLLALDDLVDDAVDAAARARALIRWSRSLLATARTTGGTASWSWSGQRTHQDPTGLSHGAAGVALALDTLAARTGDQELRRAAVMARAYERTAFDPVESNWADFRLAAGQRRWTPRYSVAWCHGAAGITLDRLRGHQLTGDSRLRDEAHAGLEATRRWLERALDASNPEFSLCHGIAGNLEVLDRGLGEPTLDLDPGPVVDRAALVRHGLARFRNVGTAGSEAPGLMTGLAGFAAFFLREAGHVSPDPLTMIVDVASTRDHSELSRRGDAPAPARAVPPALRS